MLIAHCIDFIQGFQTANATQVSGFLKAGPLKLFFCIVVGTIEYPRVVVREPLPEFLPGFPEVGCVYYYPAALIGEVLGGANRI